MAPKDIVRIAAVADLHYGRTTQAGSLQSLFAQIADTADILALPGDLTDYGLAEEARGFAKELSAVRIPIVGVLGNHDVESNQQAEIVSILKDVGVTLLDGDTTEIHGVGFAGVKGFCGGFGRRALGPWGEESIKRFVRGGRRGAEAGDRARAPAQRVPRRDPALRADPGDRRRRAVRDLPLPRLQPPRGAAHALSDQRGRPRPRAPWRPRGAHADERARLQRVALADARALSRQAVQADRGRPRQRARGRAARRRRPSRRRRCGEPAMTQPTTSSQRTRSKP